MSDDQRFLKLPKWAQGEIRRLNSNVEWWKAKATVGPEDSDTFLGSYLEDDNKPLGKGQRVVFMLDNENVIEAKNIDGKFVEVRASGRGSESINAQPHASNVLKIAAGDWW